ncbi:MAG: PSD1 domain-containing protein [Planctomycetes bacterium]|nr:PSD1 domain-containing protein [Planctomycetota bacterium]
MHASDRPLPRSPRPRLAAAALAPALLTTALAGSGTLAAPGEEARATPTQHDALPILLRHCAACHGSVRPEADLDVRSRATLLRGGKSGPAIAPGKPDESLIVKKIRAGEMPPRTRLVEACVKPVEPRDADLLERWIALGAPEVPLEPDVAGAGPDPLVSDRDREHWSFRPPAAPAPPAVKGAGRARSPIDLFLIEKLEARGLSFSPEADRLTLLRRATFDMTGLPPEPEEAQAFLEDPDPLAYEKLIERLLASPRHGERWGRFWLDVAGYADSEGKREQDLYRPHAWRYRDYVIRASNADKPYDRFVLEQVAGDELADYERAPEIDQELYENLIATGFLRMAPDATWANITGFLQDRLEVIADEVQVLGSAVLGLTIHCARCHDHKVDPIPQRDYYRLLDVFKGAFDEHDWLKPEIVPGIGPVSADRRPPRHLPHVTAAERREWEARCAQVQKEIDALAAGPKSAEVEKRLRELEASRPSEPRIHALWDRGEPSPTYVYHRGDPLQPGRLVGPGVPSVLTDGRTPFAAAPPWPGAKSTGRRFALARWLVRPDHPLTARVMVNRLWKHHFGAGIVATLDDFGKAGAPPAHPELLDWLAVELVRGGWSLKAMHHLMVTSAAYRQSSAVTQDASRLDPDGALLSRMPLRRLDAEEVHDALLAAAGSLDGAMGGPADPFEARPDGLVTTVGSGLAWRRAVYARQERKLRPTILEDFDLPLMSPSCAQRRASTTATQALHLMNNAWVLGLAARLAERVEREAGAEPARQVERASWIALGRPPSLEEGEAALGALARMTEAWAAHLAHPGPGGAGPADGPADSRAPGRLALAAYCHALVSSAGFVYVD